MPKSIHSPQQEKLCALLKEARKEAGLTQDEVSRRLGVYRSYVSKYEKGERRLDVLEFIAVTSAIGVSPEGLIIELMQSGSGTASHKRSRRS